MLDGTASWTAGVFFGFMLHCVTFVADGFVGAACPRKTSFDFTVAWPLPPDSVVGTFDR